jgi:hypothetical protein
LANDIDFNYSEATEVESDRETLCTHLSVPTCAGSAQFQGDYFLAVYSDVLESDDTEGRKLGRIRNALRNLGDLGDVGSILDGSSGIVRDDIIDRMKDILGSTRSDEEKRNLLEEILNNSGITMLDGDYYCQTFIDSVENFETESIIGIERSGKTKIKEVFVIPTVGKSRRYIDE